MLDARVNFLEVSFDEVLLRNFYKCVKVVRNKIADPFLKGRNLSAALVGGIGASRKGRRRFMASKMDGRRLVFGPGHEPRGFHFMIKYLWPIRLNIGAAEQGLHP
jgi:hypothetical protein